MGTIIQTNIFGTVVDSYLMFSVLGLVFRSLSNSWKSDTSRLRLAKLCNVHLMECLNIGCPKLLPCHLAQINSCGNTEGSISVTRDSTDRGRGYPGEGEHLDTVQHPDTEWGAGHQQYHLHVWSLVPAQCQAANGLQQEMLCAFCILFVRKIILHCGDYNNIVVDIQRFL